MNKYYIDLNQIESKSEKWYILRTKKRIKRKIDIFAGRKKIFRPVINSVY